MATAAAAGSPLRDLWTSPGRRPSRMTKGELPRWFFACSPEVTSSSKMSFLFLPFPHSHSSSGSLPHVNKQLLNRLGFLVRSPSLPSSFTRYNSPYSIFSVSAPLFRIRPPLECASDCFHPFLLLLKNPPSLFPLWFLRGEAVAAVA